MRFEHLVEVNDPFMPLLTEITREQLWRGLVLRAKDPKQFVAALEQASVDSGTERGGTLEYGRTLDFGSFRVTDRVRLVAPERCEIVTERGPTWPASRLTITIEEPAPRRLFLRFVYEADEDAEGLDALTVALRNQAYEGADLDTVVRIRELAESGALG